MPRNSETNAKERRVIQQGDSGVWATCDKGKERQCIGELRDLFAEYAETLYGHGAVKEAADPSATDLEVLPTAGIESEIQDEIGELQHRTEIELFTPVRIDVQCGERKSQNVKLQHS